MFDAGSPIGTESIEAQAVFPFVNLTDESSAQSRPLRWVYLALEDRVLNSLPVVLT